MSFVVWLPMLLEKDGAILSKGVVQPVPSVRNEGRRVRSAPAKTKVNRETHDEQLQRILHKPRGENYSDFQKETGARDSPSEGIQTTDYRRHEQNYRSDFDKLQDFTSKRVNETDNTRDYLRNKTYTTEKPMTDQRVNELFNEDYRQRSEFS